MNSSHFPLMKSLLKIQQNCKWKSTTIIVSISKYIHIIFITYMPYSHTSLHARLHTLSIGKFTLSQRTRRFTFTFFETVFYCCHVISFCNPRATEFRNVLSADSRNVDLFARRYKPDLHETNFYTGGNVYANLLQILRKNIATVRRVLYQKGS